MQPVRVRESLVRAEHKQRRRGQSKAAKGVLRFGASAAVVLLLVVAGAAGALVLAAPPWAPPAQAHTPAAILDLGVLTPPAHSMTDTAERIARRVTALAATSGTGTTGAPPPTIRVRHSARRGNETAMLAQVRDGELALALLTLTELALHDPRLRVFFAPRLAADLPAAAALLTTPTARSLFAEAPDTLGVRVLGVGLLGLRHIALAERPPANEGGPLLEGLRMRVPPVQSFELFHGLLGAETAPLPLPTARAAAEAGVVNGVDMDIEMLLAADFASATPHVVLSGHMLFPVVVVASPKVWDGLSPDLRHQIIAVVEEEFVALTAEQILREATAPAALRDAGFILHPAPPPDAFTSIRTRWWADQPDLRALADALMREGAPHASP